MGFDMQGKVVVITGASRGIGAAAAREFAHAGASVALLARSEAEIVALAAEIGPKALALRCDVADAAAVEAALVAVQARFGRLDVLINNAGVIEPIARLADAGVEAFSAAIDINLKGVFHGMRAALPLMKAQGSGTIITVSSGAAVNPMEGWGGYCASKAGALMLTRIAHLEEAAHGIRVLGMSPGTVATEMQVKIKASGVNPVSQLDFSVHIPADWPAKCLLWMCGPEADEYLGRDVSLRDEAVRRAVGLT
ncbi:SDR family oxidoreductase [Cypionkella sp.]|uniref:SDR family oxidoreductase n=1 Tax=Cypionkella sp. TaxID=2811411 RepID=UPI002603DC6B|nr:SDR family oxidoreductase [Cypionkella sp.]